MKTRNTRKSPRSFKGNVKSLQLIAHVYISCESRVVLCFILPVNISERYTLHLAEYVSFLSLYREKIWMLGLDVLLLSSTTERTIVGRDSVFIIKRPTETNPEWQDRERLWCSYQFWFFYTLRGLRLYGESDLWLVRSVWNTETCFKIISRNLSL